MVFLIQNTQNRDGKAMQLKLDELIRASKTARDSFVSLEDISDDELLEISDEFKKMHELSPSNTAIRKLHKRIEAEHVKRSSFRGISNMVVEAMHNPLGTNHPENK